MIGSDVQTAAQLLTDGKLVAIPTETVYGLAANALNSSAVLQIFKVKNRPSFDPLIVHINNIHQLGQLTAEVPTLALKLAKKFWPGPLTLILPKSALVPDVVTSGLQFVGIRMPNHELTQNLLGRLDFPLAAPSANPFGYVSPTTAQHVEDQLGFYIPYILDGGPCEVGLESTIISFEVPNKPSVLRFGGLTIEQIEEITGPIDIDITNNSDPRAPGQLDKHYATKKKLILVDFPAELQAFENTFKIGYGDGTFDYNVSDSSYMDEIASNLFDALRTADRSTYNQIAVAKVPEIGLGRAINDRLSRAAVR